MRPPRIRPCLYPRKGDGKVSDFAKRARWFSLGLGLVLVGGAAGVYLSAGPAPSPGYITPSAHARAGDPSNIFVRIAREKTPAVVNISTTQKVETGVFSDEQMREFYERFFPWFREMPQERTRQSLGSGFVVEKNGYILTNNHVVEQAVEIVVTFGDGTAGVPAKEYEAELVAADPKTDIALIKIEPGRDLPTLELGDSDSLNVGEWVMAIGNPFGLSQTVTVGIVSAKGRVIGAGLYDNFIQTDASINPGNSGGPLLDTGGKVVGINSAIFTGGMSQGNIGIGFAIPVNEVKAIYEDLKTGKVKRGWLGVKIQTITEELRKGLGLDKSVGALVSEVFKGSPADKAGIKAGDVIVEFDGEEVPSALQLPRMVGFAKPGTKTKVVVIRGDERITLTVELGEMKEADAGTPGKRTIGEETLGMRASDITPELAQRFGLEMGRGVVVTSVAPGSPAALAGIRPGDVIMELNRKPVERVEAYRKILSSVKPGDVVLMLLRRGDSSSFIAIKIPEKK